MNLLSSIIILVLSLSFSAANDRKIPETSLTKEERLLSEYLNCRREIKNQEDIRAQKSCVFAKVVATAEPSRKERLAAWLILGAELKKIRPCVAQDSLRIVAFPEKTESVACFEFILEGREKTGFAFFKEDSKKKLGLYSLHY